MLIGMIEQARKLFGYHRLPFAVNHSLPLSTVRCQRFEPVAYKTESLNSEREFIEFFPAGCGNLINRNYNSYDLRFIYEFICVNQFSSRTFLLIFCLPN